MRQTTRGFGQAAAAMVLVGTLTAVSATISRYPVYGGQAVRYAVAALILLALVRVREPGGVRVRPRDWLLLTALAATGLAGFNVSIVEGTRYTSPATIGTVIGAVPIVLAIAAPLLAGRRPAPQVITGAVIVTLGAALANGLGGGSLTGLLLAVGALAGEVCFSLLAVPLLPRLGPLRVSAYSTAAAVPLLLVVGLATSGGGVLRRPSLGEAGGYAYLSLVITAAAFVMWYDAVGRLGADRAALFAGLIPVSAVATTMALGMRAPNPSEIAGALLVACGVITGLREHGRARCRTSRVGGRRSRAASAKPSTRGHGGARSGRNTLTVDTSDTSEEIMFAFTELLPQGADETEYRLLTADGIDTLGAGGREFLRVDREVLRLLTETAIRDISHLLRPAHLAQLRRILDDPESSPNDRFVALDLLKNANIAAAGVLPMCQDTGTAIVMGKRGQHVLTDGDDERHIARGVYDAYTRLNLRYSQLAPLTMWEEKNTGTNLPAQIELYAAPGEEYKFLFMAKGGGSANKSFLYQETKAVLNHDRMMAFLEEKIRSLGTAACPPYHLAIVVGGTSAEYALKTAKYASAHYLDTLPTEGSPAGHGFRDVELEGEVFELTRRLGIGAQFGGKYFCHDVRVVRLPRHGASCPVAIAVSCSADRQALAKITREGAFLEKLEPDPARFLPETTDADLDGDVVRIDLNRPMADIRAELGRYPVKTRLSLTGPLVVARDIAHAKIKERLDAGEPMPAYLRDHAVYYAGPAKTPKGYASGSFGPTTAGRMDSYVEQFQAAGGSHVMLAKGNRSKQVTDACRAHGGFYLGSIGGPAARLAQDCIRSVEVLEYPELGMEAVWKIEVEDFPAFIVVDDKGNDFFADTTGPLLTIGTRRP